MTVLNVICSSQTATSASLATAADAVLRAQAEFIAKAWLAQSSLFDEIGHAALLACGALLNLHRAAAE